MSDTHSDALVFFGAMGDLAYKKIFVDPVLKSDTPVYGYQKGSWGPSEVNQKVTPEGGWHNPTAADQEDFRVAARTS